MYIRIVIASEAKQSSNAREASRSAWIASSLALLAMTITSMHLRDELERVLARLVVEYFGQVHRLRQAADGDQLVVEPFELVERDRRIGADGVLLHGQIVDVGRAWIVGLDAGELLRGLE